VRPAHAREIPVSLAVAHNSALCRSLTPSLSLLPDLPPGFLYRGSIEAERGKDTPQKSRSPAGQRPRLLEGLLIPNPIKPVLRSYSLLPSGSCGSRDEHLLKDLGNLINRRMLDNEWQIGAFSPQKIQIELLRIQSVRGFTKPALVSHFFVLPLTGVAARRRSRRSGCAGPSALNASLPA
jgi:hypothetical protein